MCGKDIEVYRVTLNFADISNGVANDANYLVKLPYTINNGAVFVESLMIVNVDTLFAGKEAVKVASNSFVNNHSYDTSGTNTRVITTVALEYDRFNHVDAILHDLNFSQLVNMNSCGLPVKNFSLDNNMINIKLLGEDNDGLTSGKIASYNITLLFVDYDPRPLGSVNY